MTSKLYTAIVYTNRMKELAEFYQSGLSLTNPDTSFENHIGFKIDEMYLGFDQVEADTKSTDSFVSLWFTVDNLEDVYRKFIELGARSKYPPTLKPWGDRLAAVYDPDGNIVGLAQNREYVN